MNPQTHLKEQFETTRQSEVTLTEEDILAQCGFTSEEIASLLWLRRWYQNGGSDRAVIVRYLEFLRLLVKSGDLEL
ncbi:MAG TPA: hypothetical protein VFN02_04810 [Ktedonobacteraceae bacterium]|nr:hypothetical protein [Ktedonobacteraceae bacterium]